MDINSDAGLKDILSQWTRTLFALWKQNISKKNLKYTGDLYDSFSYYVQENAGSLSGKLIIELAVQGRFQDMKVLKYTKQAPLKPILEWVEKQGLQAFSYTPFEKYKNKTPTQTRLMRNIAWGIARTFKERIVKNNKKNWKYAKTLYSGISDLKNSLFLYLQGYTKERILELLNIK